MPVIRTTTAVLNDAQGSGLSLYRHLRPFIFGNKALLHRYDVAAEKEDILLGTYQDSLDTTYDWPGRTDGTLIDLDYTKVFIDDALLNYFNDYIGTGQIIAPVAGYPNRVRSPGLIFKTANGYNRSASFYDRDVKVGDVVFLRNGSNELWTSVTDFVAETTPSVVDPATADAANKPTQSYSVSISQVAGTPLNDVSATADGTLYDSRDDGYITRTYTVTVTQSSTGNDPTTGRLSVSSADGLESQTNVVPAAFSSPTTIGTKGLTITFDYNSGSVSASAGVDPNDLVVGQQWTITVSQAFTAPAATSSGTYVGETDTTYILRVSRGGAYSGTNKPQITISTTTGVDTSGPTDVTAAATNVTVGTQGVLVQFNTTGLRKGDIYYIEVTAVGEAQIRTLVLKHNLSAALQAASDLDLRLFILQESVEISEKRALPTVGDNWIQDDEDGLTLYDGLQLTASDLTNAGVPVYVPVIGATDYSQVYLEYREWDISDAGSIFALNDRADVEALLGVVDPDNPIAYAVDKALQNTATAVLTVANTLAPTNTDVVRGAILGGALDDNEAWSDILDLVTAEELIYNLVPLTEDADIQDLVVTHVTQQSTVEVPNYRACFLAGTIEEVLVVVDATKTTDATTALATLGDDPDATGTQYTYLVVPAGNSNFITNGVRAGDTVRYEFTLDAFGEETWTEFEVGEVVSENTIRLVSGTDSAVTVAQRVEVWRSPTKDELVTQLITRAAAIESNRVCLVWPDEATSGGVAVPGYFVCAALAGLAGSVSSHQGLRNVQLLGFDSAPRSRTFFRTSNLDAMKDGGVFVVSQDISGAIYVRWAVTTDTTDITSSEEMVRRNLDMFQLVLLKDKWGEFIGSSNATDTAVGLLRTKFNELLDQISRVTFTDRLGPAVIEAVITSLQVHPTLVDRMQADITLTLPYPDNQIDLTVTI